jgi:hypothetical protein
MKHGNTWDNADTCNNAMCVFGEAILQTSKFITYSYIIQIIHILVRWNPIENGEKTHNFFINLIITSS